MDYKLPRKILVLYDGYTELRGVDGAGNLLAGKGLDRRSAETLVKELVLEDSAECLLNSFIPSSVFYIKTSLIAHTYYFKTDARQQVMLFSSRLNSLESGSYAIPNLIWRVNEGSLHLFAYKEWKDEETELFFAPFANISNHKVCTGVTIPNRFSNLSEMVSEVQRLFWDTSFTHATTSFVTKGNFASAWNRQKDKEKFDYTILQPAKQKLKDICK